MSHHDVPRTREPSRLVACLIAGLALTLLAGCAETPEPEPEPEVQTETFDVTATVRINDDTISRAVRIDRVYIGIGSVLLEPLDDLHAPLVASRDAMPVTYAPELGLDGSATTRPLTIDQPGRYLVSLSIQPLEIPLWERNNASDSIRGGNESVSMEGEYLVVDRRPSLFDPTMSPEPVPWHPGDDGIESIATELPLIESGRVSKYAFAYTTERTGYVRLGEVYLSPDQNDIQVEINLEGWLDEALDPALAELAAAPDTRLTDWFNVSSQLENSGQGLERIFQFSKASTR